MSIAEGSSAVTPARVGNDRGAPPTGVVVEMPEADVSASLPRTFCSLPFGRLRCSLRTPIARRRILEVRAGGGGGGGKCKQPGEGLEMVHGSSTCTSTVL